MTSTAVVHSNGEVNQDPSEVPFSFKGYLQGRLGIGLQESQAMADAYDRAVAALVGPNDVQRAEGKTFKKKSAWAKLGRHFGISTAVVRVETKEVEGGHIHSRVIVRALAPWGQSCEALGGCSTEEKRFRGSNARQRARADCEATAETRAHNRAISRLIAAGEVSAEEMEGSGSADRATRVQRTKPLKDRTEVELLELRTWAEKQDPPRDDVMTKVNEELERRREGALDDMPPELT